MFIIKYHYFKRVYEGCNAYNRIDGGPIWKQVTGSTLKEAMSNYRAERDDHNLAEYTVFTFDNVINTEEE